jgi:hypothetical protein
MFRKHEADCDDFLWDADNLWNEVLLASRPRSCSPVCICPGPVLHLPRLWEAFFVTRVTAFFSVSLFLHVDIQEASTGAILVDYCLKSPSRTQSPLEDDSLSGKDTGSGVCFLRERTTRVSCLSNRMCSLMVRIVIESHAYQTPLQLGVLVSKLS